MNAHSAETPGTEENGNTAHNAVLWQCTDAEQHAEEIGADVDAVQKANPIFVENLVTFIQVPVPNKSVGQAATISLWMSLFAVLWE